LLPSLVAFVFGMPKLANSGGQGIALADNDLKSSIFVEVNVLWISGRSPRGKSSPIFSRSTYGEYCTLYLQLDQLRQPSQLPF